MLVSPEVAKALAKNYTWTSSTSSGVHSFQNLFALDKTVLDKIAIELKNKVSSQTESFLSTPKKVGNAEDELKLSLIVEVIKIKEGWEEEKNNRKAITEEARRKASIAEAALQDIEVQEIKGLTKEELKALIAKA